MSDVVTEHRDRLFGLAYRMLGSAAEAEDVVQETFERWAATDPATVEDPGAWLTTVCARRGLDRLRSAQRRREEYVGPWLPEPLLTGDDDPAETALEHESLTLAFLVVLEDLRPAERVVFLLHDVFGHPHAEIAAMLDRSPEAVRQLASRARGRIRKTTPARPVEQQQGEAIVEAFLEATAGGELDQLLRLLAPEVVLTSDGGGVAPAARHPVRGADAVARFLLGIARQADESYELVPASINGGPGLLVFRHGEIDTVFSLTAVDGRVTEIRAVRNPAKLTAIHRDR